MIAAMNATSATICFHSGTGNSYRAAQWLAETAATNSLATRVTSINQA
jgi:hypothetical protein